MLDIPQEQIDITQCPFYSKEEGKIVAPMRPLRDLCLIWELPAPDKLGSIHFPEHYRKLEATGVGIVIAIGGGYYDHQRHAFIETVVKVGDIVIFDKNVPWTMPAKDGSGVEHTVRMCGEMDCKVGLRYV